MGRITEMYEAKEVSSLKLQMQNDILERSIRKLCVLPTDEVLKHWIQESKRL